MARLFPVLTEQQLDALPSQAEARVYRAMRQVLDDQHLVIHGMSFVIARKDGGHRDGEADFIVFSAQHGLLVIEVKGGGVSFDPAKGWASVDKRGQTHAIKDPVAQAKCQKFAILEQLQSDRVWVTLNRRIAYGHAVLLPDVEDVSRLVLPGCPPDIVGGSAAVRNIRSWIGSLFAYWTGASNAPLGVDGLPVVEKILCHAIEVRPLLRDLLKDEEAVRIKLTNEQASILRALNRHKRAAIVGAAGTGKTILAVEKARLFATSGERVLLLCYNKALGVTLKRQFVGASNVWVGTFHQFCQYCCKCCVDAGRGDPMAKAKAEMPNTDYYDIQLPLAAYCAIEDLGDQLRFGAIVVDEGQDFGEEYWLPIEMALKSSDASWLYIFYDENQRLYSRVSTFPIENDDTYQLTKNCRNTKPIHDLAYLFYKGDETDSSGLLGKPPEFIKADSPSAQAQAISRRVTRLIHDEGVNPEDIGILVAAQPKESYYNLLCNLPLPRPAKWVREEHFVPDSVVVDTVKRFKGIERSIIILWVDMVSIVDASLMYVGLSRAKSILIIVGSGEVVNKL